MDQHAASLNFLTRSFFILSLVALLLINVSGCSGPGYFKPIQPGSSESVLYLYRPKASNPGMQPLRFSYPEVFLDGNSIGMLKFNTRMMNMLSAGQHTLKITGLTKEADWEAHDIELTFNAAPGEAKYIKLDVQFNLNEMNLGQPKAKYIIRLTPMDNQDALYEIRDTNFNEE